ncbi:hypothetical protein [Aedoeadaptatus pacaensis]|uniref:hypothetical protein n=1 Tax=Aedoeadaptatus pacaensis TaxID=1776390 RepID=UPI000837E3A9|nr:hypothetical protein [Peptoniphilus pacaensis]
MNYFSKDERLLKNGVILLTAVVFVLLTTLLPIVTKLPGILFVNKIGFFIFTIYFGFIPSACFILLVQGVFLKFGLVGSMFSYALVINLVNALLISLIIGEKRRSIKGGVYAAIAMALLSKPISLLIMSLVTDMPVDLHSALTVKSIIEQGKVYGLSLVVAFAIYYLYEITFKTKRSDS